MGFLLTKTNHMEDEQKHSVIINNFVCTKNKLKSKTKSKKKSNKKIKRLNSFLVLQNQLKYRNDNKILYKNIRAESLNYMEYFYDDFYDNIYDYIININYINYPEYDHFDLHCIH